MLLECLKRMKGHIVFKPKIARKDTLKYILLWSDLLCFFSFSFSFFLLLLFICCRRWGIKSGIFSVLNFLYIHIMLINTAYSNQTHSVQRNQFLHTARDRTRERRKKTFCAWFYLAERDTRDKYRWWRKWKHFTVILSISILIYIQK